MICRKMRDDAEAENEISRVSKGNFYVLSAHCNMNVILCELFKKIRLLFETCLGGATPISAQSWYYI